MEKMQSSPATLHRFDLPLPCPLTCRERVELEYVSQFIPFLKFLEKTLGHEKVIEYLQEFTFDGIKEYAESVVKTRGKNDLSVFKEIFSSANPGLMEVLTVEVLEDTQDSFKLQVTECLLAEVFRKAGAAAYGTAALCRDVLFTNLVNPQIGLNLEGTLMEGYPCCTYHWYVKS